ncbi:Anti-repressor SinI [Bacillus sp. OV322]|nr:Anti-repressor SinI [Bacillus sp. OV322]
MAAGLPEIQRYFGRLMMGKTVLDLEWVELIKEAKLIGINKDEIRQFLLSKQSLFNQGGPETCKNTYRES